MKKVGSNSKLEGFKITLIIMSIPRADCPPTLFSSTLPTRCWKGSCFIENLHCRHDSRYNSRGICRHVQHQFDYNGKMHHKGGTSAQLRTKLFYGNDESKARCAIVLQDVGLIDLARAPYSEEISDSSNWSSNRHELGNIP